MVKTIFTLDTKKIIGGETYYARATTTDQSVLNASHTNDVCISLAFNCVIIIAFFKSPTKLQRKIDKIKMRKDNILYGD